MTEINIFAAHFLKVSKFFFVFICILCHRYTVVVIVVVCYNKVLMDLFIVYGDVSGLFQ